MTDPTKNERYPRILPVGETAFTVELGNHIDLTLNQKVHALDATLHTMSLPWLIETVPTYCSLLVIYDPLKANAKAVYATLQYAIANMKSVGIYAQRPIVEIPVSYDLSCGNVRLRTGIHLSARAPRPARRSPLVYAPPARASGQRRHCGWTNWYLCSGYPWGVAYHRPHRPRAFRPSPRGSLYAPRWGPRAFHTFTSLKIGEGIWSEVDFENVPDLGYNKDVQRAMEIITSVKLMLEIIEPGFLMTIQDAGRPGWARYGVPPSGPMDHAAFKAANQLVGNAPNTPALEITFIGPTLRIWRRRLIAICGATFDLWVGDLQVPMWHAVWVRAGQRVRFGQRRSGARAILAISGGLAVPAYLDSTSTYLRGTSSSPNGFGGFQGRALQAGDCIPLGPCRLASPARHAGRNLPNVKRPSYDAHPTLRVVLGPQERTFTPKSLEILLTSDYQITPDADRMGFRLQGPRIIYKDKTSMISDGIVTGSIQIPPDGQPIIMMVDHQTTGGYPKIATVIQADLPKLAQTLPHAYIRFRAISVNQAQEILNQDARQ